MSFDIYQVITNRIIEQLEQGIIPWRKPWKISGVKIKGGDDLKKVAFNRVSKIAYSALNQMLLTRAGEYASFKQWQDLGGKIKKGAKAEIVVFWKMHEITEIDTETNEPAKKKIPLLRYLQVFHIEDVENVEPLKAEELQDVKEFDPIEQAEEIINNYITRENISLTYGGNDAFYAPMSDSITLPERFKFKKNTAEFYSTAFHEITHSTGAKHRLDRLNKVSFFGSQDYSKEELVAEIGACGLLNLLNIETKSSFKNSVAYIQSWIKKLKNDNKLIVSASAKAEKAIKYIINGKTEEEQGADE